MTVQDITNEEKGLIFNIQHFSVHDGPGVRTIVFLKGCPLRCRWCSNPESMSPNPELAYNPNKCIGTDICVRCFSVCPVQAIEEEMKKDSYCSIASGHVSPGKITINRESCTNCGACTYACPAHALELFGKWMTVEKILKIVQEDTLVYSRSGGGITLSGGEPLMQAEFANKLLKESLRIGLNTAIETTGYARWEALESVCQYLDTALYDIKCMDSEKHKQFTGVSNDIILKNLKKLNQTFPKLNIIVRTPVIPGFNDTEQDILDILNFVRTLNNVKYELLPFHRLGEPKYRYLGRKYLFADVQPPSKEKMQYLEKLIQTHYLETMMES